MQKTINLQILNRMLRNANLKIAIIGQTNVGKTSLFNSLNRDGNRSGNGMGIVEDHLFTTTDYNISIFSNYDDKLQWLSDAFKIDNIVDSKVTAFDTVGLVSGSFLENNGLGSSTVQNLRSIDVFLHVLRAFHDDGVCHHDGSIDPVRDLLVVNQEILLMDLYTIEENLIQIETIIQSLGFEIPVGEHLQYQYQVLLKAWNLIHGHPRPVKEKTFGRNNTPKLRNRKPKILSKCEGYAIRYGLWDHNEMEILTPLNLLSAKEMIILLNVNTRDYLRKGDHPYLKPVQDALLQLVPAFESPSSRVSITSSTTNTIHPPKINNSNPLEIMTNEPKSSGDSVISANRSIASDISFLFHDKLKLGSSLGSSLGKGNTAIKRLTNESKLVCPLYSISILLERHLHQLRQQNVVLYNEYLLANPTHTAVFKQVLNECYRVNRFIHYYTYNSTSITRHSFRHGLTVVEAAANLNAVKSRLLTRVEVIAFEELEQVQGDRERLKREGKIKSETKKYMINDGDIINFVYMKQLK